MNRRELIELCRIFILNTCSEISVENLNEFSGEDLKEDIKREFGDIKNLRKLFTSRDL